MREFVCNYCGNTLPLLDVNLDLVINVILGYSSKYDEDRLEIRFCSACMDKIIDECKIKPVKKRQIFLRNVSPMGW